MCTVNALRLKATPLGPNQLETVPETLWFTSDTNCTWLYKAVLRRYTRSQTIAVNALFCYWDLVTTSVQLIDLLNTKNHA